MAHPTLVDMLRDAKAARDAAGHPNPKADAMLAAALAGQLKDDTAERYVGIPEGRMVTGVVADPSMADGKRFTYARPTGTSDGSSAHRPGTARLMTGGQHRYILALLDRVPAAVADVARPWFEEQLLTITLTQASEVIDRLKRHASNAPGWVPSPALPDRVTSGVNGYDESTHGPSGPAPINHARVSAWGMWRTMAQELCELGGQHGARFAVPSATGNNDLDFWSIVKRDGDRGPRFYLNRVIGGRPDRSTRMTPEAMVEVAQRIAVDPKVAMLTYGRQLGQCGHCGRTLTDQESRAAGIGPVCARRHGW